MALVGSTPSLVTARRPPTRVSTPPTVALRPPTGAGVAADAVA